MYIGMSSRDYGDMHLGDAASSDAYTMLGTAMSIAANRVSYIFDLTGPSLVVDTACSSGLVALHHACSAIRSGEATSAIVGGVNLLLSPYPFVGFSQAGMLSPEGRCKAFGADGKGYVRSEGGGALFLKPLRSEEHTSELQSHHDLVCRLLLEKTKDMLCRRANTYDR